MIKHLRKNKKGFTLIEIIVVLVIMGILLAIAIPSVLGYVGKANDSKNVAQARGGYLAAQTLTTSSITKGGLSSTDLDAEALNKELGLASGDEGSVTAAFCTVSTDKTKVTACNVVVKGMSGKYVVFANGNAEVVEGEVVDGTSATAKP